jgi:hypothetical protein
LKRRRGEKETGGRGERNRKFLLKQLTLFYVNNTLKPIAMKSIHYLGMMLGIMLIFASCSLFEDEDPNTLGGDQSPMGEVGATVSSSSMEISGVSNFAGTVTSLKDGVSTYSGSAVVKNQFLKNLLSNFPEIVMKGDTLITTGIQFKNSKDGIELKSGPTKGVLIKYGSEVGDKYTGADGTEREVVYKSSTDDFYYGFMLIKVVQVEEHTKVLKSSGVNKVTYWGNHRFGLVSVEFSFDDGTTAKFPIYNSNEN